MQAPQHYKKEGASMEERKPTVEQVLHAMTQNLGEEPRPMVLMSKVTPEMVLRQA